MWKRKEKQQQRTRNVNESNKIVNKCAENFLDGEKKSRCAHITEFLWPATAQKKNYDYFLCFAAMTSIRKQRWNSCVVFFSRVFLFICHNLCLLSWIFSFLQSRVVHLFCCRYCCCPHTHTHTHSHNKFKMHFSRFYFHQKFKRFVYAIVIGFFLESFFLGVVVISQNHGAVFLLTHRTVQNGILMNSSWLTSQMTRRYF